MVHPIVVVLLDDEPGGIEVVHPGGNLLIVLALAVDGVDQHRALHVHPAEKADGLHQPGADPVGRSLLVYLHHRIGKHIGREVEAQMPVEVSSEMLHIGVLDSLLQPHQLYVLGHHVDEQVGGQAVGAVGEPLHQIGVHKGSDAHRTAPVVDLSVVVHHLELADHVAEFPQLPVPQPFGGILVQHGDLIVGDLIHLGGKIPVLHREQPGVGLGPENDAARQTAHQGQRHHSDCQEKRNPALLLYKFEILPRPLALEAGGKDSADTVGRAQQQDKGVEVRRLQIEGGQLEVKVEESHRQRDGDIGQYPGRRALDLPAGLLGFRRLGLRGCAAVKALPPEAAGIAA